MSKSVLIIVSGSIAAYKALNVIRRLRERNIRVTCILTKGGAEFVTPLSLAALSGNPVYGDLFSLKDETEMGHIRLARENDLIAVVPASADILAKMANGNADDLATATLLATGTPVLVAPAMNTKMYEHPATRRNLAQLRKDGVHILDPDAGDLACGEKGEGRLAEVDHIVTAITEQLGISQKLRGITALVTSGPTHEPIDPVRYIANRSSGKQGHAIAQALTDAGALVTLVTGPTHEPDPDVSQIIRVQTAENMWDACKSLLPVNVVICSAAVGDWRAKDTLPHKLKKRSNASPPAIVLADNPDILAMLSKPGANRPRLVVGFAAETESVKKNAEEKRRAKGCDWIVGNDVSNGRVFGKEETSAWLVTGQGAEEWKDISKQELARRLVDRIVKHLGKNTHDKNSTHRLIAR